MLRQEQFDTVDTVGLILGRVAPSQHHVGFLYLADNVPLVLHLGWHFDLRQEDPWEGPWSSRYAWENLNIEDEENRLAIAAVLGNIWLSKQNNIPYGFTYSGVAFNADGTFNPPPMGQGLTCATFIIKVLASAGFSLIDLASWENRDGDDQWRDFIVQALAERAAPDHIEALRQDRHAVRIRPEDVVAAGISQPWPMRFQDVEAIAEQVLQDLYGMVPA